jgi:16S rRNA (adenine1518-N6/adenine1519-N6)-dimethyltransferase
LNLSDPGTLRAFLQRHGLSARKGLGQHFLCSSVAVNAIFSAASDCAGVLEIGPGPGVLTRPFSLVSSVLALEVDDRMIEALSESAPAARVLKQDALTADLPSLLRELPSPRAVVSNLPYYITGPLLTAIAGARSEFSKAVLMMQKEVAARILAPPGNSDRGSLSVFLQAQFEIKKVASVPPGAFLPPPKVESAVLLFTPLPENDDPALFDFVRVGFTQPRKTLANNLSVGLGKSREEVTDAMTAIGLDVRVRPQVLTVDHWRSLRKALE